MEPAPIFDHPSHKGSGKLEGQVAIITGGDSGIGRAVAIAFAKEGADVVIAYLNEQEDAKETVRAVEQYGRKCYRRPGPERLCDIVLREGRYTFPVNGCNMPARLSDAKKGPPPGRMWPLLISRAGGSPR